MQTTQIQLIMHMLYLCSLHFCCTFAYIKKCPKDPTCCTFLKRGLSRISIINNTGPSVSSFGIFIHCKDIKKAHLTTEDILKLIIIVCLALLKYHSQSISSTSPRFSLFGHLRHLVDLWWEKQTNKTQ